jgi:hypothetical protein
MSVVSVFKRSISSPPFSFWDTNRVGCNMDVLLLRIGDQLLTLEKWVALNLIDGWSNSSSFDDGIELFIQDRLRLIFNSK